MAVSPHAHFRRSRARKAAIRQPTAIETKNTTSRVLMTPRAKGASRASKLTKLIDVAEPADAERVADEADDPLEEREEHRTVTKKAMTWLSVSAEMSRPIDTAARAVEHEARGSPAPTGAAVERAEVPREPEHHERIERRRRDQEEHEAPGAEELAEDDLVVAHRQGDEHLERAAPLLLGEEAHRHDRHDEEREPAGHEREELRERGAIGLPEAAAAEEEHEAQHDQPRADHDVGQR